MDLVIEELGARADLIETVAGWIYRSWWTQVPGASAGTLAAMLRANIARPPPPLTLVACVAQQPVGTVSLLAHDVGTQRWAALSPWLAALYVEPAARRKGVGAALIGSALAAAARFAAGPVYLLTIDTQAYFARLGWMRVGQHDEAVVMSRTLGNPKP
jgi:predicted N-acetyltransferase YhbS